MTLHKFNLPDVGEGLTEAEIVAWKVKPGDTVAINDVLCEIETAKSLVELPSPFAGTVTELLVPEGLTVDVGTAIISVSDAAPAADAAVEPAPAAPAPDVPLYGKLEPDTSDAGDSAGRPAGGPLVGSGPKADAVKRRRRVAGPAASPAVSAATAETAPLASRWGSRRTTSGSARRPSHIRSARPPPVPPKPLTSVPPSGGAHQRTRQQGPGQASVRKSPATSASTYPTSSPPAPAGGDARGPGQLPGPARRGSGQGRHPLGQDRPPAGTAHRADPGQGCPQGHRAGHGRVGLCRHRT